MDRGVNAAGLRVRALLGLMLGSMLLFVGGIADAITLAEALRLAAEANPTLRVARRELDVAKGTLTQAKLYPFNPELDTNFRYGYGKGFNEDTGIRHDLIDGGIALSQVIEVQGQRGLRTRIASRNVDRVNWEIRDLERNVAAGVGRAFSGVMIAQERVKLAQQIEALAREVREIARKRFEAGDVPELDLLRADVELQRAGNARTAEERRLATVRRELNLLLGQPAESPIEAQGLLLLKPPPGELPALLAQAGVQRPDLNAIQSGLRAAEAAIDLVQAEAFLPAVKLAAGYEEGLDFDNRNRRGLVSLVIPLPLFNRRQGDLQAALGERSRREAEIALVRARIDKEVSTAFHQVTLSDQIVSQYLNKILPGQEENFRLLREGYRLGQFPLTDLLIGQREFIDVRLAYLEAIAEFNEAVAELYRAIGAATLQ